MWRRVIGSFLGFDILDTTDSRPFHSSQEYETYFREKTADEVSPEHIVRAPHDVGIYRGLRKRPLASISRTTDGKFVLDKDSEEGGFTSVRKPVRGLAKLRPTYSPYYRPHVPVVNGFRRLNQDTDNWMDHWRHLPAGVEGGVYHVPAGTTEPLIYQIPHHPSRFDLRSEGLGMSASRGMAFSPFRSSLSPEFGRHFIPGSPGDVPSTGPGRRRRVRSSSPLPYSDAWSQLAQLGSFSEMSSVRQPSSVERSFPSTVLSSFQRTPPMYGIPFSASYLLNGRSQITYNQIIQQQEMMLRHHQLMMRQQQEKSLQRELPVISPLQRRVIRAEIHSPEHQLRSMYYMNQRRPVSWLIPRSSTTEIHGYIPLRSAPRSRFQVPESHMFTPPYRETVSYGYAPSQGTSRHYVNLPPRRGNDQRILGQDPYHLLKPSSSESQKPLATSSPPCPRVPPLSQDRDEPRKVKPSTKTRVPELKAKSKDRIKFESRSQGLGDSDTSSDQPAAYTRDHLQQAIGRVRSGILRTRRPHSAPILSSAGRTDSSLISSSLDSDKRIFVKVTKDGESVPTSYDKSQEISHEQSPDSSSGFGSKNTSHQQSSSQSAHSASGLGLDSSQFESYEVARPSSEWKSETQIPHLPLWPQVPTRPTVPHRPPSYDQWLSRQVLPQFRLSGTVQPFPSGRYPTLLMGVPRPPSQTLVPMPVQEDLSIDSTGAQTLPEPLNFYGSFDNHAVTDQTYRQVQSIRPDQELLEPLTVSTPSHSLTLGHTPVLDVSVDDHYEFDTVLSPTPGVDESDSFWSRPRLHSGDRGLSDSEIYGSGGRRKESHASMEARVAAMKQEFHEYRQRQAKRRSSRELESVC